MISHYSLQLLCRTHERGMFCSGEDALDRYLREQASQDMKRYCSTVVVATKPHSSVVLGYYTISASAARLDDIPDAMRRRLPRYDNIPAVLLGRLAVTETEKGSGLGSWLLVDAMARAKRCGIAWSIFTVKAKHERAADFYRRFSFAPFVSDSLILWLSHQEVEKLLLS